MKYLKNENIFTVRNIEIQTHYNFLSGKLNKFIEIANIIL